MAFRPSLRRHQKIETLEPNLIPVMNLMVVLIPLLLSSAEFVRIGMLELNLPPAVGAGVAESRMPAEVQKTLDLTITITDKGFYLSSALGIARREEGPTIPLVNGEYDYQSLSEVLYEIKKKAVGRFRDDERIIIAAEEDIPYQVVISTMDASRSILKDGNLIPLFPDVLLSAGVVL